VRQQPNLRGLRPRGAAGLQVRSSAFDHDDLIPNRYSREGNNISPDLQWSRIPSKASELLLLMEDPDAPHRTVLHWLVTGIDPRCTGVRLGGTPKGGKVWCNDFGGLGYGGPQRTVRPHRYFFRLLALAVPVRLPRHPSAADVHRAVRGLVLASGALVGRYEH
jgi:Raf kinase inhibitor-like YbhB/YbcL family protein